MVTIVALRRHTHSERIARRIEAESFTALAKYLQRVLRTLGRVPASAIPQPLPAIEPVMVCKFGEHPDMVGSITLSP